MASLARCSIAIPASAFGAMRMIYAGARDGRGISVDVLVEPG
jgi:hypothetical protein